MARITETIPDPIFQKLRFKKDEEGYGDKSWTDYFRFLTKDTSLDRTVGQLLGDATRDTLARLWMKNFALNIQGGLLTDHKLWELPKLTGPALVVGAGPSVKANNHLQILDDWVSDDIHRRTLLTIFSTDRMLTPLCKQTDLVPDYVVTVDGNAEKIHLFYDDPSVQAAVSDKRPKALLAGTVSPNVVTLCRKIGIPIYWFIALLDQFTLTNNITRLMYFMTSEKVQKEADEATAVNCGGNAGSSSWALANYLNAPEIGLIGLDYGYLKGTPIEETAYYAALKDKAKSVNEIFALYFNDHNPDFDLDCYSDIMFAHYKEAFLSMVELAHSLRPMKTVNCTEGGILHGSQIKGMKFIDWLNSVEKNYA
jgi:hypothetical protein